LSYTEGCLGGEDVFFEKVLADKIFHVPLEALAIDSPVSLTVVIRTIFFYFGECRVVLDRPRSPHPRLVFDGIEDLGPPLVDPVPPEAPLRVQLQSLFTAWAPKNTSV